MTVAEVRTTSVTAILALTSASHPWASAWAESTPLMIAWRTLANVVTVNEQRIPSPTPFEAVPPLSVTVKLPVADPAALN